MDFWNRQKVKNLESKIKELESRLHGDRVPGFYCEGCIHAVNSMVEVSSGVFAKGYDCRLNYNCKDFKRKDAES